MFALPSPIPISQQTWKRKNSQANKLFLQNHLLSADPLILIALQIMFPPTFLQAPEIEKSVGDVSVQDVLKKGTEWTYDQN